MVLAALTLKRKCCSPAFAPFMAQIFSGANSAVFNSLWRGVRIMCGLHAPLRQIPVMVTGFKEPGGCAICPNECLRWRRLAPVWMNAEKMLIYSRPPAGRQYHAGLI